MKPKLVVKTTKGHRYLQLLDLHGNLIHIGNADKLENWCVAIQALQYNYDGLAIQEALELDQEKVLQSLKKFNGDPPSEAWKKYCEKRIQARINYEFIVKTINKVPEEQMIQELVDYRTNLEAWTAVSNRFHLSPDYYEILSPLVWEGAPVGVGVDLPGDAEEEVA